MRNQQGSREEFKGDKDIRINERRKREENERRDQHGEENNTKKINRDLRRSTYCRRRRIDWIKGEKKRSTQRRGDQGR